MVKDERKGGLQSEMTAFADLGLMTGIKNSVDNEIEIIKSRNIVEKSIRKLNFNVDFFTEGRVKTIELYKDNPIEVSFFDTNDLFYKKSNAFIVNAKSPTTFELSKPNGKSLGIFRYGSIIRLDNAKMVITRKALLQDVAHKDFTITIRIRNLSSVVQTYKNRLKIAPLNKNSSVVELTVNDPVAEKAEDLLNTVIEIYNQDAIDDKNLSKSV
jgi:uncharacterized protein involved in exopolysaccharide biosynthesis